MVKKAVKKRVAKKSTGGAVKPPTLDPFSDEGISKIAIATAKQWAATTNDLKHFFCQAASALKLRCLI